MSSPRFARTVSWVILLLAGGGCGQPPVDHEDALVVLTAYLDGRIPRLMSQYVVPGSGIALIRDGELVWSRAYGSADREHKQRMTLDAVYRAESISKSVTAWGVMRLVEQGRIDLDAPVQRYLRDWQL